MILELIFGLAILGVVFYILFKMLDSIAVGALLVLAIFISSYLILGSFPEITNVPIIGQFLPKTGQIIAVIGDSQYSIDILDVSIASNGNVLVAVLNNGNLGLTNLTAHVDGMPVEIVKGDKVINSGDVTVLELAWSGEFKRVVISNEYARNSHEL